MVKRYLADHDRYSLYGVERPEFARALGVIAARGGRFIRRGVEAFIAKIAAAPGVDAGYRDNAEAIARILITHYEVILGGDYLARHSARNRETIEALAEAGADMRALLAASSFLIEAFLREKAPRRWLGGSALVDEIDALQRALICDVATAVTMEQLSIIAKEQTRSERLSDQLQDFRSIIEGVSTELAQASASADEALAVVSGAADHALSRSRVAADATEHSNRNLTASATGTEQLSVSIKELTRQSEMSRDVVARVEGAVSSARTAIADLEASAHKIGSIVDLISRIAEQTNLLALNATIEAARAGEAGRGFAVVAQEVKALASQTTKATQDIVEQINAVQSATARSVGEIGSMGGAMDDLAHCAAEVSAAISQQDELTTELARNLHETVSQVVSASDGYVAASALMEAAGSETARLREAVGLLSRIGAALIRDVDSFSERIKAA